MSSLKHQKITAYGISTFKGHRNSINPHHLGINLGKVQNILICQSYNGPLAAKTIKQQFTNDLISLSSRNKGAKMDTVIQQAYRSVQNKIMQKQIINQDNSGSSLASVIIKDDLIIVANAGPSQVLCFTKKSSLLKLSEAHTAQNMSERKRIIDNGGHIYQTIVNVQNQNDLKIQGPLRISPSGITYTRTMGRAYDFKKQGINANQTMPIQFPLMWKPQLKYVKTQDVLWLGIFSEGVIDCVGIDFIKEIIKNQIHKKSENFNEHKICYEASRKILDFTLKKGVVDAMSSIILLFTEVPGIHQIPQITLGKDKAIQQKLTIQQKNKSINMTYAKKPLIKQTDSYLQKSLQKKSKQKSIKKTIKTKPN